MRQFIPQALKTSAVVGSILVTINQFEAVIGDASFNWWKVGLTYMVPFCVYMYSAYNTTRSCSKQKEAKNFQSSSQHNVKPTLAKPAHQCLSGLFVVSHVDAAAQ